MRFPQSSVSVLKQNWQFDLAELGGQHSEDTNDMRVDRDVLIGMTRWMYSSRPTVPIPLGNRVVIWQTKDPKTIGQ